MRARSRATRTNKRVSSVHYLTQFNLMWASVSEAAPAAEPANQPPGLSAFLPAVLGAMMLYYFLIIRPDRKKQVAHRSALEQLKKNDRVVTIGGLKGTVVQVRREIDEITLKVDDNTKVRFTMSAIARLDGAAAAEEEKPAA